MKKNKQIPIVKIVIIIAFIICFLSIIGYYFMYQDSQVITAVKASQTALNNGNLNTAIQDLNKVGTRTFADRQLVEHQESAINDFKNISNQFNTASNYLNNDQYAQCLQILDSLHTSNPYLNSKIQNALTVCNESFPQLLYKEGLTALRNGDRSQATTYYDQSEKRYPNSPFTKLLGDYLNGDASPTVNSLNIVISRPNIGTITSSPESTTPTTTTTTVQPPSTSVTSTAIQPKVTNTSSTVTAHIANNNNSNSTSNSNSNNNITNSSSSTLKNAPVTIAHFSTTKPDSAPVKQTVPTPQIQTPKAKSVSTTTTPASNTHTDTSDKTTDVKVNK